jgi:hypothetical protein
MVVKKTIKHSWRKPNAGEKNGHAMEKQLVADSVILESVKWMLTLFASLLVYGVGVLLIRQFYHPDVSGSIALAMQTLISYSPTTCVPEPVERMLYFAAVLLIPVSIFLIYRLLNRYLVFTITRPLKLLFYSGLILFMLAVVFLAWGGLGATNPCAGNIQSAHDEESLTNLDFYFIHTFIYGHFLQFLLFFTLLVVLFLIPINMTRKRVVFFRRSLKWFTRSFCLILLIAIFLVSAFRFPYTHENKYDFNAVYYSVVQVYRGMPLLVDHFTNTYGLYPHFLVPFLKITGLSVLNFSVLMGLLSALCFVFLFYVLRFAVKSWLLVLAGFTTIFFMSFMYGKVMGRYDPYFAMWPIRYIFPMLLLFFAVVYLKSKSKILYYASFFIFAAGILWNPDFGMITFLSLIFFFTFLSFGECGLRKGLAKSAIHLGVAAGSLALTFLSYSVIIRLFYGNFPQLVEMFSTLNGFAVVGANMLPLPSSLHPWMILALVYISGLVYSIGHLAKREVTPHVAFVFLVTVLGIGMFSYYIGRSHNWNLLSCAPPAFLLATILAGDLIPLVKITRWLALPFVLLLFMLSFSFFNTLYDYKNIVSLVYETENKIENSDEQSYIERQAAFIRKNTVENEKVLIFPATPHQALMYDLSGTRSAINPGLMDMFFETEYQRLLTFLAKNKDVKVFFDPLNFWYSDTHIPAILSALYKVDKMEEVGGLICLSKRSEAVALLTIPGSDTGLIFHEFPEKNLRRKAESWQGSKEKLITGRNFSLEVLFKPSGLPVTPFTQQAVILQNWVDTTGFTLQQKADDITQFQFGVPHHGVTFNVDTGKWNYLCIRVRNNTIRTFINGQLMPDVVSPCSFTDSEGPVFIGSNKLQGGFYFGDIGEIRIRRYPPDDAELAGNWKQISSELLR